jgi:hypothetical protein
LIENEYTNYECLHAKSQTLNPDQKSGILTPNQKSKTLNPDQKSGTLNPNQKSEPLNPNQKSETLNPKKNPQPKPAVRFSLAPVFLSLVPVTSFSVAAPIPLLC